MKVPRKKSLKPRSGKHVVVIGLGNIGSPLADMLTRTEAVQRLTLIDQDVYQTSNLLGQPIRRCDIGRSKAMVQAERARDLRPDLRVEAFHSALKDVPPGRMRGNLVATGLDSKSSRQQVNQRIWRLDTPWVDAGVMADGRLARVSVYLPGDNQPCLECAWDENDYRALEVRRPCQAEAQVAPTASPAFLGSLAAALQMTECEKILHEDWKSVAAGKQITIAAGSHKLYETSLRRNLNCRFDHQTCEVQPLLCDSRSSSLEALISQLKRTSPATPFRFQVEGKFFERQLRCSCGEEKAVFCVEGRMKAGERACPRCQKPMDAIGFSMLSSVSEEELRPEDGARSLPLMGFESGDLLMMKTTSGIRAFELQLK